MTTQSKDVATPAETPLEEGLRCYAPKDGAARRMAVSDFIVALLLPNERRPSPRR